LSSAKLRLHPNPVTLDRNYRGKVSAKGMALLKQLLEMDPSKRITAKQALDSDYFDNFKSRRQKSPSVNQRVLSSTYRTTYAKMEKSEMEKRAPSYSQGRRKKYDEKERSESRGHQ
jgi:serine/threonine protein kinase